MKSVPCRMADYDRSPTPATTMLSLCIHLSRSGVQLSNGISARSWDFQSCMAAFSPCNNSTISRAPSVPHYQHCSCHQSHHHAPPPPPSPVRGSLLGQQCDHGLADAMLQLPFPPGKYVIARHTALLNVAFNCMIPCPSREKRVIMSILSEYIHFQPRG
jgi:hypothetical protein